MIYYASLLQDTTGSGVNATAVFYQIEKQFGLNQPIYAQFYVYLHQVFSLPPNFGPSFEYFPYPAWSVVMGALKWTLLLLGTSQAISWTLGVGMGVYSPSTRAESWTRWWSRCCSSSSLSLPSGSD